jgi:hypothetical protein
VSERGRLLEALAALIADYRPDEIQPRTPDLIDAWIQQFPSDQQVGLLGALIHVFGKTYITRSMFDAFLEELASTDKLAPGRSPLEFWSEANLLNIQKGGNSQKEILAAFDDVLFTTHGIHLADTGSDNGDFVYLDDCIGTGNRVRGDICGWLDGDTPTKLNLHIITPILYKGSWWIDEKIRETAAANGKEVSIKKWRLDQFEMENRRAYRNRSDVLWPTVLSDDPSVQAYVANLESLGHPPVLRTAGHAGVSGIFADDAQRMMLEEALVVRGCQIRQESDNLPAKARPLGYHNLDCLGFGSMFVTYRNCPNNCPLAFWVQQAGYPALFPRKTNTQTAARWA